MALTRRSELPWPGARSEWIVLRVEPTDIVIRARDLGARTRRGWIYEGVTCTLREGDVGAITGPAGSGRTSLLLAIAGRMPFSTGSLVVCGAHLPDDVKSVRATVAVARAGGVAELEPDLRVRDHIVERAGGQREALFDKACGRLGLAVDGDLLAGDLTAFQGTLLTIALALLEEPGVVVLDDVDRGLSGAQQSEIWQRIRTLTEDGVTVLATTTDPAPAQGWADVITDITAGAA